MKRFLLLVIAVMILLAGCSKEEDVYYSDENLETPFYVHGISDHHYGGDETCIYLIEFDKEMDFPQTALKKFGRTKKEFNKEKRVHLYYYPNSLPNSQRYSELGKKSELTKEEMRKFIDIILEEDRYLYSQIFETEGRESFKTNRE